MSQLFTRVLFSFVLATSLPQLATAGESSEGPVYQRQRQHPMHGGSHYYGHGGGYGHGYYGNYYPAHIYGSWYQRPYPTHLDYFRLRGTAVPRADCPCANVP